MVELEIDGQKVEIVEGSMVMHAANKLGVYVPHFCYHKKLSIAANCRMCLVEIEKAPKPMPACATPVTAGMKVFTKSEKAIKAQKGVMEFLLINHPLDCPICDQGGECQLQDLAVGYGGSASRYDQAKRVVFHKPMGSLISAQEMSRCIHCTRCVRFGQEVAGVMELGMTGRGEHSEIMSFVGNSIDSELSGNMIDVCPVGALTSKPFRYSARTWELSRRKSIAAHDSLGSNTTVQIKGNKVMRVLPLENEAVNECWLSDRDRFSYEGLNSSQRLTRPMIKQDGDWREVDWQVALEYAGHALASVKTESGADKIGFIAHPNSTLEELSLLGSLARGVGSDNVDFRIRQTDFSLDAQRAGVPWLGMQLADVATLDRLLIIGATMRQDHPLLSSRVRQAAKRGLKVSSIHALKEDLLMPVANQVVAAPSQWVAQLVQVLAALLSSKEQGVPEALQKVTVSDQAKAIAQSLSSGRKVAIWLGNAAQQHAQYASLMHLAQALAQASGGLFGVIGDAANSVGGYLAKALPQAKGANAKTMFEQPLSAYVLLNVEPTLDLVNPLLANQSLAAAKSVIALTTFASDELFAIADCLLPVCPATETAGTFVNCEGRAQSFKGVVQPLGESRPAWKVLRVMGNLLSVAGFVQDSAEAVRKTIVAKTDTEGGAWVVGLNNQISGAAPALGVPAVSGLERLSLVPAYHGDGVVRRSECLQDTRSARSAALGLNRKTLAALGLTAGTPVRVSQAGGGRTQLVVELDDRLAANTIRIDAARIETASIGAMTGVITVEKV
jgi:NADH-quinone oxidoreductase subunit G